MEVAPDSLHYFLRAAGVFAAVALCAFGVIAVAGFLLHVNRVKTLRKEQARTEQNPNDVI